MRRIPPLFSCTFLLAGGLAWLACGTSPETPPPATEETDLPSSNVVMAARLRAIADAVDPSEYPYDNERRAESAYERALASPPGPQRFQELLQASLESIRAGVPEQGIERLREALELLQQSGVPLNRETSLSMLRLQASAGLRLGEQENCLLHHTAESCILPISEAGIHTVERGSRTAIDALQKLLQLDPGNAGYRWLLNLAHMTLGEYPDGVDPVHRLPAEIFESDEDLGRFADVAAAAGVAVRARSGGVVMEDFDGDGRLDLMASSWGLRDPLRYFRHLEDGGFEDRSEVAGLAGQLGGLNLTHADYDNDGDADVLVLRGAWLFDQGEIPDSLLRNDGQGRFTDVTESAGLLVSLPSHTAAWGDYDNDGWLDLFVGSEPSRGRRHPSRLYRNLGDSQGFVEVAAEVGLRVTGVVKAATWGDYDNDGLIDLYVSRFGEDNLLWRNLGAVDGGRDGGGWRFEDVTAAAGVAEPRGSFPAWFFDYDNDGWLDLFVAGFGGFDGDSLADFVSHYVAPPTGTTCRLFRNQGDGTPPDGPRFVDVTSGSGLDRAVLAMGANFGDLDNDGWLDLYLGTGEPMMTTLVPNLMFRNDRGRGFQDVTTSGGFGNIQKGHGVAFGDLDGDGDQDVYITMGGAYSGDVYPNLLFENPGHGHRWLTVRFAGSTTNRAAIGARVEVMIDSDAGRRSIHRVVGTGGSFGSSTLQLEIGLGDATAIVALEVFWPASGRRTRYTDVPLDAVVLVREEATILERIEALPAALYDDVDEGGAIDHEGHSGA